MSDDLLSHAPAFQTEETRPSSEDRATLYRQRATDLLNSITARTQQALSERGIEFDVFFFVPRSGDALILFGTTVEPDPSEEQWGTVSEVVTEIVREALGMDRARAREVACALVRPPA